MNAGTLAEITDAFFGGDILEDQWFTIDAIDSQTYAISEYGHWEKVHSYLIIGSNSAVLLDTGIGIGDISLVVKKLTALPIKVVTSHVHWDHIGGHGKFDEIYVHELEEDWIINGIPGLPIEEIRYNVGREITKPIPQNFQIKSYEPFTGQPTKLMKDGDEINLGDRTLQIIHTPGHSPGHICVFEKEREYLYTADLIYKGTLYAFYPTTDPKLFVESVRKISNLESVRRVLPGHNEFPLDHNFIKSIKQACEELEKLGKVKHGTGIHKYDEFEIYF